MMEFLKKKLSLFLTVVLVVSSMCMTVLAATGPGSNETGDIPREELESIGLQQTAVVKENAAVYQSSEGSCGENVTWEFSDDGTLTISGIGEIKDAESPWWGDSLRGEIQKVVISEGITYIGEEVFSSHSQLTEVSLPKSLKRIGEYAFWGCGKLSKITLSEGLTTIGKSAFQGCSSLKEIKLPASLTSLGNFVFSGCSITDFTVDANNEMFSEENGVLYNKDKTMLVSYVTNTTDQFTIPDTVTSINDYAFGNCTGLTGVTIPSGVTSIGMGAFYGCDGLKSVILPSGLEKISAEMFYMCSSLTTIEIPDGVTEIGDYAFCCCRGLTDVTIPSGVTSIGMRAFSNCSGLKSVTLPSGLKKISAEMFMYCNNLKTVNIPDSITEIGERAFCYCFSLTGVAIPSKVTSIGTRAFDHTDLKSVTLPSGLKETYGAFYGCRSLTSVKISDGVTELGEYMFYACTSLKSIAIPASVKKIGMYIFGEYSKLEKITVAADNKYYCAEDNVLFDKGKKTVLWAACKLSGNYVVPESVTEISEYAFFECTDLTSVVLPAGIKAVNAYAFGSSVKTARMTGNAPSCYRNEGKIEDNHPFESSTTIYYPKGASGYTEGIWKNYTCKAYMPVSKVVLNKTTASLYTGSSLTLKATVSPSDAAYKTVTWSSSNTKIATVSSKGVVKGLLPGTVTITAKTDNGKKATCKVTIKLATPKLGKVTSAGYDKVKVTWSKVTGATGYYVYRKNGSSWKLVKTITSGSTVSFTDSKLNCGQTYTYTVKAYRKSGSSIVKSGYNSAGISGKPVLSAPVLKSVSKASNTSLKVTWGKVSGANGYVIYRKTANGSFKKVKTITKGTTVSWTDTGLKKGTKYIYTVKAYRTVNKKNVYSTYNKTGLARTLK